MRFIYRWLKRPLVLIILVLVIIFLIKRLNVFDGIFRSKPLIIDNTPLIIKEIKAIGELNTATLYKEVVVDSSAKGLLPFSAKREIVLIVKGTVTAGINLNNVNDSTVYVKDDSVNMILPPATITNVIMNPSDIETFYESGQWNNSEITKLKLSARSILIREAAKNQLLEKADQKARMVIEQFLRGAGFTKINVRQ